ncbi:MAG: M48 family metallopeptidase [Lutibacter sp.]|uniref:M48 family metallopeptidase n=1 Tax=Lutibacter sp. TaxID=1925666 RepID=UPI0017DB7BCE|nr:M48 family metallopeptidase [Lutibacter sp.]MBT8317185.1 M48 family metallopeptidase [Lutibacter sp.]NNJ58044.1 M48 family metallopeptidase [Lutibacter sp.]
MKKIITLGVLFLFIVSCSTVPITGRKRVNLVSDAQILPASFAQYEGFLKENKISSNVKMTNEIQDVGMNISKAVDKFMRANGMVSEADSYRWEFNLIDDETVNAWCMPGGKVVFYTGILPICDNTDGIAAVMGHEVAHAFAKHGQERMTSAYGQQLGGIAVAIGTNNKDPKTRALWNTVYGVGSTVGMLAYSRTHETEADKLGMVFMIMAGYKPEEAVNVWIRMGQRAGGQAPPEFLSTHPSNESRVKNLRAYLPTAIEQAKKYGVQ